MGVSSGAKLVIPGAANQFALSRRKLEQMHERLTATGYVSFVN